jgi:hypothetical protein
MSYHQLIQYFILVEEIFIENLALNHLISLISQLSIQPSHILANWLSANLYIVANFPTFIYSIYDDHIKTDEF